MSCLWVNHPTDLRFDSHISNLRESPPTKSGLKEESDKNVLSISTRAILFTKESVVNLYLGMKAMAACVFCGSNAARAEVICSLNQPAKPECN
jgi:hypothetical protein